MVVSFRGYGRAERAAGVVEDELAAAEDELGVLEAVLMEIVSGCFCSAVASAYDRSLRLFDTQATAREFHIHD